MKLKIFTEGGSGIGLGHVSRCSSLYDEAISRGVETTIFVYGNIHRAGILGDRNVCIQDWLSKSFLHENIQDDEYCIVDSYMITEGLLEVIAENSKRALFIDDNARVRYPNGIVVNPSLYPYHLNYPIVDNTVYLLGREYVIVRNQFRNCRRTSINEIVKTVLITMGGADRGITHTIIQAICTRYPEIQFFAVVGDLLQSELWVKDRNIGNVKFYSDIDAETMKNLMVQSDFAITAAGQTIYELLATQTPFIPVKTVDNQENNIKGLKSINPDLVIIPLDCSFQITLNEEVATMLTFDNRQTFLSDNYYIDGKGSARIINRLLC